jgi:DNA-binding transcriptional MerR regulator
MSSSLAIGDFSRATHLTVKTLRHYHETGLLEPAQIDSQTGYRRYTTEQIPVAQIIKRFRDLDMPLIDIRAVLSAPDVQARNNLIAAHLKRLESDLARTNAAVASLRNLLEHPTPEVAIGRMQAPGVLRLDGRSFKRADWDDRFGFLLTCSVLRARIVSVCTRTLCAHLGSEYAPDRLIDPYYLMD